MEYIIRIAAYRWGRSSVGSIKYLRHANLLTRSQNEKQRKPWFLLAVFAPALALAQGQRPQPSATSPQTAAAPAPIELAKRAAIKALLDAIDADKLAAAIGNGAQNQAKQLVPAVLSEALNENKTLNEEQKRTLVPSLQQNVVPKLAEQAGGVF